MSVPPAYQLSVNELSALVGQSRTNIIETIEDEYLNKSLSNKVNILPQAVRTFLMEHGVDYTFRTIANINLKGGIGKTTSTINTATRACQYGFKVCILDIDSQASASLAFDCLPKDNEPIFYDVWQRPDEMVPAALKNIQENLSILPSGLENGLLDVSLVNPTMQKNAVRGVCAVLKEQGFDLVIIDCPPSLGTAVISTICASDIIITPVDHSPFAKKGLQLTLNEVEAICDTFNLKAPEVKILFTHFDRRIKQCHEMQAYLQEEFPDALVPTPIHVNTEYSKTLANKRTIFASSVRGPAKDDYDYFVRYLLKLDINPMSDVK